MVIGVKSVVWPSGIKLLGWVRGLVLHSINSTGSEEEAHTTSVLSSTLAKISFKAASWLVLQSHDHGLLASVKAAE